MPTVEYNLDGDAGDFVQEMGDAVQAMASVERQSEDTTTATTKLTAAQKRSAAAAKESRKEFADNVATVRHLGEMFKWGAESAGRLISGFVGIVRSAVEARKELADFISADDQARLDELAKGLQAADDASSVLGATMATSLSPQIEEVIGVLVGATVKLGEFIDEVERLRNDETAKWLAETADTLGKIATLGASDAIWSGIAKLGDEGKEAAEELEKIRAAIDFKDFGPTPEQLDAVAQDRVDAEKKANDAAAKERAKHVANIKALDAEIYDAMEKEQQAAAAAEAEYQEFRYESWKSTLDQQLSDLETYTEAVLENFDKEAEAYTEGIEKRREETPLLLAEIGKAWADLGGDLAGIWQQNSEDYTATLEEQEDALRTKLKNADAGERALIKQRLAENKMMQEATRESARKAFAVSQTAAVASVLLSGAMAFMALLPSFAYLGPFAPLAAGAIAGPATAGQLAVIANTKGPAHDGRAFGADEFMVGGQMVRQGERGVVLNQRAVDAGATEAAMEMNRTGRTSGPQEVVLADSGRVIARAVIRDARRPGSPFAVGSDGSGNPFRRGR